MLRHDKVRYSWPLFKFIFFCEIVEYSMRSRCFTIFRIHKYFTQFVLNIIWVHHIDTYIFCNFFCLIQSILLFYFAHLANFQMLLDFSCARAIINLWTISLGYFFFFFWNIRLLKSLKVIWVGVLDVFPIWNS